MSSPTFEDLRVHHGTGRAYTISGTGRTRVMGYRLGKQCNLGDIEASEWASMVKTLIAESGEQELHQQLYTFLKEHNYANSSKSKLEEEALELHAARIFDDQLWVEFIAFNKQFRPEALNTVKFVTVLPDCCGKEGKITEKSFLHRTSSQNENFCPHCGRWTTIHLPENTLKGDAPRIC